MSAAAMQVAVFGAGYVGCVTAAGLGRLGHSVHLVEVVEAKVRTIAAGRSPVSEPGVGDELAAMLAAGRLRVGADAAAALAAADVAMVCVGTPPAADGAADVAQVERVLRQIAAVVAARPAAEPLVVALRSTAPWPRLRDGVLAELAAAPPAGWGDRVRFALNPELLREGTGLADFLAPPFVVVGSDDPAAAAVLRELYAGLSAPFHAVAPGTASLAKYACNYFHALKVAFANDVAGLAPAFAADPLAVMELLVSDRQLNLSPAYLRPAFAFGGPCLPKDLEALTRVAAAAGADRRLCEAVAATNASLVDRAAAAVGRLAKGRVALLGLSFKNGTDDLRGSPLLELAARLTERGLELAIYDPDIAPGALLGANLAHALERLPAIAELFCDHPAAALAGAALVVVGKSRAAAVELPAGVPVLDLTRTLTAAPGRRVLTLDQVEPVAATAEAR